MKIHKKRTGLMLLLVISVLLVTGCTSKVSDLDKYLNTGESIDEYAAEVLPKLSELGDYTDIDFQYYRVKTVFESQSIVLVTEYDAEEYSRQKEDILQKYVFLDHTIALDDESWIIPEYEFSMDGFDFLVVDDSYSDAIEYPKSFAMMGTNDDTCEIAYLYYYDPDLDIITGVAAGVYEKDQKMEYFVDTYFAYEFDKD